MRHAAGSQYGACISRWQTCHFIGKRIELTAASYVGGVNEKGGRRAGLVTQISTQVFAINQWQINLPILRFRPG